MKTTTDQEFTEREEEQGHGGQMQMNGFMPMKQDI